MSLFERILFSFKVEVIGKKKQEAQLMLTTPHDTMFYDNRVSAYLVPFSR